MTSKRSLFIGSSAGLGALVLFLFFYRGHILFSAPTWAKIVFWPGFQAGYFVFDLLYYKISGSRGEALCTWVSLFAGICATALAYGLLFMLFTMAYRAVYGKGKPG
ncbi:MAG: hypothetical protein EHM45_18470 [Desulfobacteraceae bacterium]|nr:MAG: hypothetical protein EHM45_18470 [Desulfobacteraceae bacterium]